MVAATVSAVERSTAAPAASAAGATPAAARLAARTAGQEPRDKEEKVDPDKLRDVSQKLCLVLLDDEVYIFTLSFIFDQITWKLLSGEGEGTYFFDCRV